MRAAPPFRMVVSDLDGTLLGSDGQLSDETIATLQALRSDGVYVVAATGRAPRSAMHRLRGHGVVDALVCSNGAIVHDPELDRTTRRRPIDPSVLTETLTALDAALGDLSYCWELDDRYGWDAGFEHIASVHEDTTGFAVESRPGPRTEVTKVMVAHPTLQRLDLRDALAEVVPSPVTLGCSGVEFVEMTAHDVNKATTVASLTAAREISPEQVIAFGDNANDLELLEWAGTGVAVANAIDEARSTADIVIGHHAATPWLATSGRCGSDLPP